MRGLYYNADLSCVSATVKEFSEFNSMVTLDTPYSSLSVIYSSDEWSSTPIYKWPDGAFLIISGWFVYKGARNDLNAFAESYRKGPTSALKNVLAGVFTGCYVSSNGSIEFFNDPLGLSSHYIDVSEHAVAPCLAAMPKKELDEEAKSFYDKVGFLYGNKTIYSNIERIQPGCIQSFSKRKNYYQLGTYCGEPISQVPDWIGELVTLWNTQDRVLALSGGLDSRLILSCGEFHYGYTYGPENSPDRVISREFSDFFDVYEEFDYDAPKKLEGEEHLCDTMFYGSGNWVYRLLTAYRYVRQRSGNAHVFYDGYLGDVLQRGVYLKFSGLLGEIFQLFPILYHLPFVSSKWLIKKRYPKLKSQEHETLYKDYQAKTEGLPLFELQKYCYYEFVHLKGGRSVITGGVQTAGQLFTVVPVFTHLKVFESLIAKDPRDGIAFKLLRTIWSQVDIRFSKAKTEMGFRPNLPYFFVPFIYFIGRFKTHFLPGNENYVHQMNRAKKNDV